MECSYNETLRLWDAATGAVLEMLEGYTSNVNSVAFSPNGKLQSALRVISDWVGEGNVEILLLPYDYRLPCYIVN